MYLSSLKKNYLALYLLVKNVLFSQHCFHKVVIKFRIQTELTVFFHVFVNGVVYLSTAVGFVPIGHAEICYSTPQSKFHLQYAWGQYASALALRFWQYNEKHSFLLQAIEKNGFIVQRSICRILSEMAFTLGYSLHCFLCTP